jgi:hypothetical protein
MAVTTMLTAYRCVEKGDLGAAKSSLADFMANWCGATALQSGSGTMPARTLALIRSESQAFPRLARVIEERIQEWQSKSISTMIEGE